MTFKCNSNHAPESNLRHYSQRFAIDIIAKRQRKITPCKSYLLQKQFLVSSSEVEDKLFVIDNAARIASITKISR